MITQRIFSVASNGGARIRSVVTSFSVLTLAAYFLHSSALRAGDLALQNGDRIVFAGDSITDAKKWTHYLASYLILANPDKLLHVQTEGRGGTTVAGYLASAETISEYEQYPKMVLPYKPRYVFTMFGHNGSASPAEYRADYEKLIDQFITSGHGLTGYAGAIPILVGPHPKSTSDGKPILGAYEDELGALAAQRGIGFSATWHRLEDAWTKPENRPLIGGVDDVHPGTAGHIAIAYAVAENLGWDREVSSANIDAVLAEVVDQKHCFIDKIVPNSFGGVDFDRLDARLPWAIDEIGRNDASQLLPEIKGWQKYMLSLSGLATGTYQILVDGVPVADVGSDQLIQGWNMADLTTGPVWEQGQEVLGRIRDMHGVDRVTLGRVGLPWVGVEKYKSSVISNYVTKGLRGQALIDSQAANLDLIGRLDQSIHDAAQPKARSFSVRFKGKAEMPKQADLQVRLMLPDRAVEQGTPLSYALAATNLGPDTANAVAVSHILPAAATYVSSTLGTYDGTTRILNIPMGDLATGATATATVIVTPNTAGTLSMTASGTQATSDPASENNTGAGSVAITASSSPLTPPPVAGSYLPPVGVPNPRWSETLHPIDTEKPTLPTAWSGADALGCYYVDSNHPQATNTNNPNGNPDLPRLSVPSTLAAGSKVFIAFCRTAVVLKSATGTADLPIWLLGTGSATILTGAVSKAIAISGTSSYVLVDGIFMDGSGAPDTSGSGGFSVSDGANHVCIRNCAVKNYVAPPYNPARFSSGGAGAWFHSLNGVSSGSGNVSDVVIHKLDCSGNAGGQNLDYESGRHAMHVTGSVSGSYSTKDIWILECNLSDNPEDGIQVGQTSSSSVQSACSNIYIGGNVISRNGENAVDLKACDKVVVSRNVMQGYKPTAYRAGAVSGSDGSACVINDDGRGPLESWWLFNRIFESRGAIRNQAAGGKHYVVGNLAYRMQLTESDAATSGGYSRGTFYWQSGGGDVFLVSNTVYDVEGGFYLHNVPGAYVWGNIVCDIRNNGVGYPIYINNSDSVSVGENFYFDSDAPVRRDGNALSLANRDQIDVDPQLVAPPFDMSLAASSPARGTTTASLVYDTYEATFGVSIRFDAFGNSFPSGTAWHAGAVQGPSAATPLRSPSGLRVIVK
jgi:uncharacterized repeat protein (TIGR01451 family)